MNSTFCTILSKTRLYQAIALFCSLHEVMKSFHLYTLCVDDDTYNLLNKMNWANVTLIHLKDLEDDGLKSLRKVRKLNEFCWTLKPIFIENIMGKYPFLERVTYIDSDLFFFNSPQIVFKNQPNCSVLLSRGEVYIPTIPTEFINFMQELTGNYNSGFISFKNDEAGRNCIRWWKNECIRKCSDDLESGSFGDQKYLDFMPSLFNNICDISTPGVNIGHWDYVRYRFHVINGKVFVDHSELICYHFSGFRIINKTEITQIYEQGRIDFPIVYSIYKSVIKDVISLIEKIEPKFKGYTTEEDMTTGKINLNPSAKGE